VVRVDGNGGTGAPLAKLRDFREKKVGCMGIAKVEASREKSLSPLTTF